ncbi:hypothetical protein [Paenibacillus sp. MMS18-CY102]|uniref:hypothetical protein n=1 Tax=Paenibacillus sp. MMS18-CY102 TaxID=2682849 RepID=UPI00136533A0|nr:hypothetical protein [Paenibacillus sp. MMS18-CY102]MWC30593.1 hypothetical protein [Paenibacillus sp. MMS18-CY102]
MKGKLRTQGLAALCALLLLSSAPGGVDAASSNPAPAPAKDLLKENNLDIAYANTKGTMLLSLGLTKADDAERYMRAICEPNKPFAIVHSGYQAGDGKGTGRQTAANFTHEAGALFYTMWGSKAANNQSCIISTTEAWSGYTFLPYKTAKGEKLSGVTVKRIEKIRQRKAIQHERIGTIGKDTVVAVVQFEPRKGENPLAGIVLVTPDTTILLDLPGNNDSNSTWRVDDGGVIEASQFRVIASAKAASGYALGLEWFGAEGNSIYVLKQTGRRFEQVEHQGRYMSP